MMKKLYENSKTKINKEKEKKEKDANNAKE